MELRTTNGQLQIEDVIIEANSSPVNLIEFNKGYSIEPVIANGKFSTYAVRNKHGQPLGCHLTFVNDKLWKAFIFVAEGNEKSGVTLNLPSHVKDALSNVGGAYQI